MVMVLVEMLMKRPPPTPRRSGDDNGVDFPLTGGSDVVGFALSQNRRGLLPPPL
jgi:hypothetical protein